MHLTYRRTCRLCGSKSLTPVIDLGEQYLQGSFVKPGKEQPPERKIECKLVRCDPTVDENACGLVQMAHTVPPEILYSAYWYRSGTNSTMRNHLMDLVDDAFAMNKSVSSVLDIGCNDGTLLSNYGDGVLKTGIDPSDVAQEIDLVNCEVYQDIFPAPHLDYKEEFDIITSIAMFYDLEDPISFCKGIKKALNKEGIWIFEQSYMPEMLKMNSYDTICHEHIEYYSLAVIEKCLYMAGLKVIRIEFNEINGGSIRCYATHIENNSYNKDEWREVIEETRIKEFDMKLDTDEPYRKFQDNIEKHRKELTRLIHAIRGSGKTIHIYGASTKGNVILQHCDIDNKLIPYAAERNPDKWGGRTLGTNIEMISEEESRKMKPDFYLVLPWHFKSEFLVREKEIIEAGTLFIFPLPNVVVLPEHKDPMMEWVKEFFKF